MPRGGARPGAGRKRKDAASVAQVRALAEKMAADGKLSPLDYILSIVRGETGAEERVRLQAAAIAAPFVHVKPTETGKKDERQDAAKKASGGQFSAPKTPPRLVSSR